MNENTEVSRLVTTDITKFILAVICSVASKLLSQENDTMAKVTEEVLRNYREFDVERTIDNEKDTTASNTLLFDKNVATDSSLSPVDKAVYSVLCALINPETLQCSPKVKIIAEKASCSESAVRKSLATLEKHKVIKRKFRYINHRQISSLYTVIRAEAETSSNEENTQTHTHSNTTPVEAEKNSAVEKVSNITEATPTCFLGDTKNKAIALHEEEGDDGQYHKEGEKILLESFKDSIRGATLPALAEKDLNTISVTSPEEVNSAEEQKDSPTGGAPLPISYPEIPEEMMRRYEENRRKYHEICETPEITSERAKKRAQIIKARKEYDEYVDMITDKTIPPQGTFEFLAWKSQNIRKNYEEEFGRPQEPQSVASLLGGVLDDILKPKAVSPENSSVQEHKPSVTEIKTVSTSNPTETNEKTAQKMASAEPVVPESISTPKTANSPDEHPAPKTESNPPIKTAAPSEPKKSNKSKSSSGGNPKDIYSPDYAPEVMRPTAEYLLCKTGRKGLREEEISILRELSAIHYPTVVNKEIRRACARFEKKKEPLECLTLMYIAVGLRKWRSFGKKKKQELSEEKKKYFAQYEPKKKTEEEKAAILAELRELEASLD